MTAPWSPTRDEVVRHPELAHLALLDHELTLIEQVLAEAHARGGRDQPARDQARSIVGVMRLLRIQVEAYRQLLALPSDNVR